MIGRFVGTAHTLLRRRDVTALGLLALLGGHASLAQATAGMDAPQVSRPAIGPLPRVPLTTMNGQPRWLDSELAVDAPLVLNFIFTTCSSSCSVQTAVLAQVQQAWAARKRPLRFASITIDPDNDTPEQLRRFSKSFGVHSGWEFYTGRFDDLLRVQRHFDVYRGSKASHPPVLMLRRHPRSPWLRVEGFPTAAQIVALLDSLPEAA